MYEVLPHLFIGYFHYQQEEAKIQQIGVSHVVKVVDKKNKETKAEDLEAEVFLEKYSYHGHTLDVLVFHQETEKISQTENDESNLKCLEVDLDTNEKPDASIFSEVNDFIHDARQDVDATVLLLDKSGDLETTALLATVYLMAVTRLTGSEAVRAVLADQLEPLSCLAEEVEGRLVDWEWEVAGLVRERLRLAMVAGSNQGGEQAWAEHRLELYYSMISGDSKSGDEGDLNDHLAVDDHFAKLISKKKNQKKKKILKEELKAPSIPSYLKREERRKIPPEGVQSQKPGGDYYSLCPSPSYPHHEEFLPPPPQRTPPPKPKYKLPRTPPAPKRKLPRNPSIPRSLPRTPQIVRKSYVRHKDISIKKI